MTTKIEWTDETWNPVTGCTKVSAGCANCYAERVMARFEPGRKFTDVRLHEDRIVKPLRWRKPRMVFVNSMSDLFHESIETETIDAVFGIMAAAKDHTFQILTKRPERMAEYTQGLGRMDENDRGGRLDTAASFYIGKMEQRFTYEDQEVHQYEERLDCMMGSYPFRNVWLGTSVEDQATADERIPHLLKCPAVVRFVSAEPLLGPVDLDKYELMCKTWRKGYTIGVYLDWVIVGGESGPKARPMHPDWAGHIRDQCNAAGVPFFFKQWGEWLGTRPEDPKPPVGRFVCREVEWNGGMSAWRVGKKKAGRLLAGREWNEMPEREGERIGND